MRTLSFLALATALALTACADDGGTPCPPDVTAFEADLWRPVLENRCNICHNATGLARRSRFVLSAPGSASGAMGDNLAAAERMARTLEDGQPLLLRRPLGVDHPGGALVVEGSPEHQALVAFVGQVRGDGRQQVRRNRHLPHACRALWLAHDVLTVDAHHATGDGQTPPVHVDIPTSQLDQLTEPQTAPRGQQRHEAQPLRRRSHEGGQLLERGRLDPASPLRLTCPANGARIRRNQFLNHGGSKDGPQQ